jgi:hypothetical protein
MTHQSLKMQDVEFQQPTVLLEAESLERLYGLDLSNIKRKLMEPFPEGKGWTKAQCDEAELWYKRFLHSIVIDPSKPHVPNGPIDDFWHMHILDTRAYRKDCDYVFGYFLDHYPYYGLNGDAIQRDESFVETNAQYNALFGEDCLHMTEFTLSRGSIDGNVGLATVCGDGGGCSGSGNIYAKLHTARSCGAQEPMPTD